MKCFDYAKCAIFDRTNLMQELKSLDKLFGDDTIEAMVVDVLRDKSV